jgi:UDP-2,3-diacylglucosamine pyrophosphatase LpxH
MTAHDEIITAWTSVLAPLQGEIRLVARLSDPLIRNDRADVFVFVPDLHLVSATRQRTFGNYGFNHRDEKVLAKLLASLVRLRNAWDNAGTRKLVTVQLGDFFDLWRELGPLQSASSVDDDEHGELRDVLYRGVHRGRPCLKATMLLGNHDSHNGTFLPEIPFLLKAFNRSPTNEPFLFVTHGDCFDLLELRTADWLQEFVVHFAGRLTPSNKYSIADWGRSAASENKPIANLRDSIMKPLHDLDPQGAVKVTAGAPLPPRLLRSVEPTDGGRRFDDYYRAFTSPGVQTTDGAKVRVVVAGHTHRAGMMLAQPQGAKPLLLLDAGAWIEKCSYPLDESGAQVTEPSAQLAVIHGNDARVYQIRVGVGS